DLGAAQGLHAARFVDLLDREIVAALHVLAAERELAAERQHHTDADLVLRGRLTGPAEGAQPNCRNNCSGPSQCFSPHEPLLVILAPPAAPALLVRSMP